MEKDCRLAACWEELHKSEPDFTGENEFMQTAWEKGEDEIYSFLLTLLCS